MTDMADYPSVTVRYGIPNQRQLSLGLEGIGRNTATSSHIFSAAFFFPTSKTSHATQRSLVFLWFSPS
jgi:hypothetical protein